MLKSKLLSTGSVLYQTEGPPPAHTTQIVYCGHTAGDYTRNLQMAALQSSRNGSSSSSYFGVPMVAPLLYPCIVNGTRPPPSSLFHTMLAVGPDALRCNAQIKPV